MQVHIGIWDGGDPRASPAYLDWFGGVIDYNKLPYSIVVDGIKLTDYSTGQRYKYTDLDGSWKSIEAMEGEVLGRI